MSRTWHLSSRTIGNNVFPVNIDRGRDQIVSTQATELVDLGAFWREAVLTSGEQSELFRIMVDASGERAQVTRAGVSVLDEDYRRTRKLIVPDQTLSHIRERVEALRPELENHWNLRLGPLQTPAFLRYHPGDFFLPHTDNVHNLRQPLEILRRQFTIVVFVNGHGSIEQERFNGGELVLYRLGERPSWHDYAVTVTPEAGAVVGFPADVKHEVCEVIDGYRCTVAAWFEYPR